MNPDLEAQRERQREDVAAIPSELCETASRRSWNCEPGRDAVTLEAALRALAESLVVEDEVVADTLSDLRRRYRAQLIMSSVARVAPDDDREGECDEPAGIGALLPGIAAIAEKDVPVDSATAERIRTYTALVTWADQVRSN